MSLLFRNQSLPLAFIAGIDTANSLPSRSQAQLFTVPKCTVMKAAHALQDNLIDTEKEREYKLEFCLWLHCLPAHAKLAHKNIATWAWLWLQKFWTLLLLVPDCLDWLQLICSEKGMPIWEYWYWREKVCKYVSWLKAIVKAEVASHFLQDALLWNCREEAPLWLNHVCCAAQTGWEVARCPPKYQQPMASIAGTLEGSGLAGNVDRKLQLRPRRYMLFSCMIMS